MKKSHFFVPIIFLVLVILVFVIYSLFFKSSLTKIDNLFYNTDSTFTKVCVDESWSSIGDVRTYRFHCYTHSNSELPEYLRENDILNYIPVIGLKTDSKYHYLCAQIDNNKGRSERELFTVFLIINDKIFIYHKEGNSISRREVDAVEALQFSRGLRKSLMGAEPGLYIGK